MWPPKAPAARVKQARAQLLEATAELRELAHGLHPMVLAQSGLKAALETLVDRSAIPVRLHVAVDGRLPREIEATVYYLVSEALTKYGASFWRGHRHRQCHTGP